MRTSRIFLSATLVSVAGCGVSSVATMNTAGETLLTWEAFKLQAYQEPDTGVFVTNGDELVEDEAEFRATYDRYLANARAEASGLGTSRQGLIVNTVNGKDDRWSAAAAMNITYCVSQSSFGADYAQVVTAIQTAASDWEVVAAVNFVHVSTFDGDCSRNTAGVVFDVREGRSGQYLARAFFPSNSRRSREIIVDRTSFGNIAPWTLAGVLRHELGHTLGFRHEHTRPEAATCFEDTRWRALTAYYSASVMHYPQCNGTNEGDLVLSAKDTAGAASLYPR
ncbi:MAG: M57 family metalloprotease [Myxococcaceae bacterium]